MFYFEAQIPEGLESIAESELSSLLPPRAWRLRRKDQGAIQFDYTADVLHLLTLKTVAAIYWVQRFEIPRPRALLGDENLRALVRQVSMAVGLWHTDRFRTFSLSAAGSGSSVMQRLKRELELMTGLKYDPQGGHLFLRLRRPLDGHSGWEVLTRLSPMPLSARAWRVCDLEGALNAPVAHAMARMTMPDAEDVYVNLLCGSGTLMIERLSCGPAAAVIGCDLSGKALRCCRRNLDAAGHAGTVRLVRGDGRALPFADQSVDVVAADLPFGSRVGSHAENIRLYPLVLEEAARITKPGGRSIIISHEVRLTNSLLTKNPDWELMSETKVGLRGLHPRIFLLRRR